MIFSLFPRNRLDPTIGALYGAIVAQARSPSFYRDYGVPDTVNGRFDMVVLHLALLLERLEGGDASARLRGQGVFDLFCAEMDGHFREAGVSDLKVPQEMREMGQAFYGRRKVYREALAETDNARLEAALIRNVYSSQPHAQAHAAPLAVYVRSALQSLDQTDGLESGQIAWPDPSALTIVGAIRAQE